MEPKESSQKKNDQIYCLDCDKYFQNQESFNIEHNKTIYKVLNKNHKYIKESNSFNIISKILISNNLLSSAIKEQQNQIIELTKRLDIYEDSFKDISFDCNVIVRNGKEKIKNLGKCNLQFFPRKIFFRIECKGDIGKDEKNKFQIDIIFPFREANLKQCSIERFNGCYLSDSLSDGEGNSFNYYHNYTCYLEQNNCIISVKSLKDYLLPGKFEKNKINIILNGMLSFDSLISNFNTPIILYNVLDKTFLCYENYQWKFTDNFIDEESGKLNKNCLVNIFLDNNSKVKIKGEHKYLAFEPKFSTMDEKEALLDINLVNKMYGLVEIGKNGKYLAMDKEGNVCYSSEKMYYLICNV